jgi:two-component system, chemotaxis family, chemotaxis protein CheY
MQSDRLPPGGTILVVEDNRDLRESLCELLSDVGYATADVANGEEALLYLQEHERPSLILLDLMMPVMSGWEFRERQRQDPSLAAIPVIVLTGVRSSAEATAALDAVAYLQKPADARVLLDTIARYC